MSGKNSQASPTPLLLFLSCVGPLLYQESHAEPCKPQNNRFLSKVVKIKTHKYHHATRNIRQKIWIFNLSNWVYRFLWYSAQWMVTGLRKIFQQSQVKAWSSYVEAILETTTISFHLVAPFSVVCPASTMMGHWQLCCCRSSPALVVKCDLCPSPLNQLVLKFQQPADLF